MIIVNKFVNSDRFCKQFRLIISDQVETNCFFCKIGQRISDINRFNCVIDVDVNSAIVICFFNEIFFSIMPSFRLIKQINFDLICCGNSE